MEIPRALRFRIIEKIAAVMLIEAALHCVVFERRRDAGIADVVAGIDQRC